MPKGPNGQKRPADAIGLAVMIGKIATGEVEDETNPDSSEPSKRSAGGRARAANLSPEKRSDIATNAANCRWNPKSQ
jgi:hypothetical protein